MSAGDSLETRGSFDPLDHPETWHAALHRLQESAAPHALASVVGAAGSTPREPGAKLVVTPTEVIDTLGGGHFEQQVIETARRHLKAMPVAAGTYLEAFPLGGRSGQCCGGFVHVLIEIFAGAESHLTLFGAGHVGQALVELLAPLPWRIDWYDSRAEAFPLQDGHNGYPTRVRPMELIPNAEDIDRAVAAIPPASHVLVMTHDHAQDRALIAALLSRTNSSQEAWRSIGMIGSRSKWASFRSRLAAAGFDDTALARVRCPIGLGSTVNKRPQEIAISVAAELLAQPRPSSKPAQRGIAPATLRNTFSAFEPLESAPFVKDPARE
ncbi:xanthine dehydrogenase accessory protein XdhC [Salinicola sp. MH3R3-1]|uniref:xanthine dehydrogenase accessory protein XdhC n=1 Tax=Salinicola sp. MH3R3-1 TaxID=1928762 RepID=UPI00094E39C4|nr:xanthine dehydrogenase accessory protein XdhC [Salinicola sp. MH3R3-1]OLO06379.1 xanthine dehydrogenase accessory protein XdhC [Salinicola sp. MH3R3-1]